MRVSLLFLLIVGTLFSYTKAEKIDTSNKITLESTDDIDANTTPYNQAITLLNSLPKDRDTFKKTKPITNGLFQSQFQKITHFIYQRLFHSENSKNPEAKHPKLQQATTLLEAEAKLGNADAIFTLAELNFFSYYGYPRNLKLAFDYYSQLASEKGNATAQRMVAFMYSTGIGRVVERDQGKALLYSTFASSGQDTVAQMMMGFRYLMGIGTPRDCEQAVKYYKEVADKAMDHFRSGPAGSRVLPYPKIRLPDEHGGVYGYSEDIHHDESDVENIIQYLRELAENGSIEAQLTLARIYYRGGHHIQRNYREAYTYYVSVAKHGKDVKDPKARKEIAKAYGMLGEMFRRGEGVPQDYTAAYKWYQYGALQDDPVAINGLGEMYLKGVVVDKDVVEARRYFEKAADLDNAEAQVNLGLLYLNAPEPDYEAAYRLFYKAHEVKNLSAFYYLAELINKGQGRQRSCTTAVALYKSLVEKGDWLYSPFPQARHAYDKGDIETAFLWYLMSAEMGYELGQTNVAWLLDHDQYGLMEQSPDLVSEDMPLIYWTRSANQGRSDSRVKMGDYYYYGIGTDVDLKKAASCYEIAAQYEFNELGMWNMGWMYENGIGVPKDFHLAKREYDKSLSQKPEAYLPVTLSLLKLNVKYLWSYLMGEDVGDLPYLKSSVYVEEDIERPSSNPSGDTYDELSSDGELQRIAQDEQYNQWTRKKFDEDEDYEERQDYGDEEDGDFIEDLVILALCLLVGWMVYMRQFRAAGPNPQPPPPQMDPRWRWGPLA